VKLAYVTARFGGYSFYGNPTETTRVEWYVDESLPPEAVEMAKRNAERQCEWVANDRLRRYDCFGREVARTSSEGAAVKDLDAKLDSLAKKRDYAADVLNKPALALSYQMSIDQLLAAAELAVKEQK